MRRPTVRTEAVVVITEPVDGSRRGPRAKQQQRTERDQVTVTIDPVVMAAARQLCGPHQRIILISENVVEVVNR